MTRPFPTICASIAIGASIACSQVTPPTAKAVPEETVDAPTSAPAPVKMPALALALVLDRSGSMLGQKIDELKTAAKGVSDALGPDDRLEVIAFDSTPQRIVDMRPGDESMVNDPAIDRIAANGGTDLLPALGDAYADLSFVAARRKHAIVVTDGQWPAANLIENVEIAAAQGMTLTTVALGVDADETTLQAMAANGGGRFYRVVDPAALTSVLAQELAIVRSGSSTSTTY